MDIYKENGFASRIAYLQHLADNYGVPFDAVETLADLLGPDEDFDGLVIAVEDAQGDFE